MASVPDNEDRARDYRLLESSSDTRVAALKRDLVLQLYTREGPFWEAVREVRGRWRIEASAQIPSHPLDQTLLPPGLSFAPPPPSSEKEWEEWFGTYEAWIGDLEAIARIVIPDRYIGEKFRPDWGSFLSACVRFDPSVPGLLEFADLGGPWAESLPLEPNKEFPEVSFVMLKPPIVEMGDPEEAVRIEKHYWQTLLERVWELYLKPLGLSLAEVLEEIHQRYPEIESRRDERPNRGAQNRYIEVDEYTTKDQVDAAFRIITERHESRPREGRPRQDRLLAVECAVLYDLQNEPDPADGRRRKWTFTRLSEQYDELKSPRAAKASVELGREILSQHKGM